MNIEELKKSGRIFYSVLAGSHAYGTATETSDEDYRGYYYEPWTSYMGIDQVVEQISDNKNDVTYYNLKRAFELLRTANPNQIELLWIPEDCVKIYNADVMDDLLAERKLFITEKAYYSHGHYAYAQIKKAKGANKRVHNPQPETPPKKEDFTWIITNWEGIPDESGRALKFPARPVSLEKSGLDLSKYHVAALEHVHDTYRLYYYGDEARGVFRGDGMLVPESISIEDELTKFAGLLIFNKDAYNKALVEWNQYWDWRKNRNESRWVAQEKGQLNYDQKNMMHCMRLMLSARNILTEGEPIVRFEGEELAYLRSIRAGELEYEEIMERVDKLEKETEAIFKKGALPKKPNPKKLDTLYRHLMGKLETT